MCAVCHAGPAAEMQEALLSVCSRVLAPFHVVDKPFRGPILRGMLKDPRLLLWYTEELLRNVLGEIASAAQVGAAPVHIVVGSI